MLKQVITFSKSAKRDILEIFGKTVDKDRCIVEQSDSNQKVVDLHGEEIELSKFAGITKGSEKYIKKDINSIIELSDILNKRVPVK
jgi:hypothetical protein